MDGETVLQEKREEILSVAEKHGARNIRIFGSVARGQAYERQPGALDGYIGSD